MSRVAWSMITAKLCRSLWGDTERPLKEVQLLVAAQTCLSRMYSKPARVIAAASAFTNNSGTGTDPRAASQARRSAAVSFQSGRHPELDIPDEGFDSGESSVACGCAVAAFFL